MSEAVLGKASDRLPWLEPYRAPPSRGKARFLGLAGMLVVIGAGVASLVLLPQTRVEAPPAPMPQAGVKLPEPVTPATETAAPASPVGAAQPATEIVKAPAKPPRRSYRPVKRRVLKAPVERLAYREVVLQQAVTAPKPVPAPADPPLVTPAPAPYGLPLAGPAPASYAPSLVRPTPVLADPPLVRPIVNPAAVLVRGKTVQLGAYQTPRQAEIAWRRAIRDYTFLVTFPKNIQQVRYGSRGLRFYRLQLGTPSKRHARQLCANLKSTGRNCTVA